MNYTLGYQNFLSANVKKLSNFNGKTKQKKAKF